MVRVRLSRWRRSLGLHPTPLIGLGVILGVLGLKHLGWLQPWELQAYDQLVRWFEQGPPDPRLLVVEITEADLQEQGQVPVPDVAIVEAVAALAQHRPTVIAIDLFRDLPIPRQGDPHATATVAAALRQNPLTLGICRIADQANPVGVPPPPDVPPERIGYADVPQDPDRVLRRNLLFLDPPKVSRCQARASLAALAALHYLSRQGLPPPVLTPNGDLIWGQAQLPQLRSSLGGYQSIDERGFQLLLRYRSPDQVAERVSLTQVLEGQVAPEQIQDRIILLGVTAESAKDSFATPYQSGSSSSQPMPGVLIHAQMLSQILRIVLDGEPPIQSWPEAGEALWILCLGAVGTGLGARLAHPGVLGLAGLGVAGLVVGSFALFYAHGIWVPVISPLWVVALTAMAGRLTRAYLQEKLLAGRYRIMRMLGSGGMGLVYLAQDTHQPVRPCVLKQLKLPTQNPKALTTYKQLFRTEGNILTILGGHAQIPTLYAHFYFEEEHRFYLVEEYIEGQSLEQVIRPGRCLPCDWVLKLLREMLQILSYIHSQNVIHRDIKPSNMIRRTVPSPTGQEFVLIDFGTVRQMIQPTDPTSDHAMVGTYGYAPYEQMEGQAVPASDLYALGMVCIQALTGKSISETIALLENQTLSRFGGRQVHWCHTVPDPLDPQFITVLDGLVKLELAERYSTATQVLQDLKQIPDHPVQSLSVPAYEPNSGPQLSVRTLSQQTTITHDQDTVARVEPMTESLPLQPYQALIFDMDGVIVLSEPLHLEAGRMALERYGISIDFETLHTQFRGRSDHDLFSHILHHHGPAHISVQRLIQDKTEIFLSRLDRVVPVAGSVEFIQRARRYCAQVGLTTSASRQEQQRVFQLFDLQPWFNVVVTADDVQKAKPDPEPYATTVQQLGCDPGRCLVIEDALHGIQAAREAGCEVMGLTTSFDREQLLAAGAIAAIHSFAELQFFLQQKRGL